MRRPSLRLATKSASGDVKRKFVLSERLQRLAVPRELACYWLTDDRHRLYCGRISCVQVIPEIERVNGGGVVASNSKLEKYRAKRDFTQTVEPSGEAVVAAAARRRFIIQKH